MPSPCGKSIYIISFIVEASLGYIRKRLFSRKPPDLNREVTKLNRKVSELNRTTPLNSIGQLVKLLD